MPDHLPDGIDIDNEEWYYLNQCLGRQHIDIDNKNFQLKKFFEWSDWMEKLNYITGWVNVLMFLVMLVYILVSIQRKVPHTPFMWVMIGLLTFIELFVGFGQIYYGDVLSNLCNFALKAIYGVEIIVLFSMAAIISYKTRNLIYDIYEFVVNRQLLSEKTKRNRNIILIGFSCLFGSFLICYITLSGIFVNQANFSAFNFINLIGTLMQILVFSLVSGSYYLALRKLMKLQANYKNNRNKKKPIMLRTSRTLIVLIVSYSATVIVLIFGLISTVKLTYSFSDFIG